jgi:erythronate-4-phosphate dehydrogenase
MLIVADQNITEVKAAFAEFGDVQTMPGRAMTAAEVAGADMLLVRSVTPVNEALLAGSKVGFVASATSGIDHVDVPYLRSRGIAFADAPGSNAESVAQYVVSAVLVRLAAQERKADGLTAAIIGCGHVGSRVAAKLGSIGITCLLNDPPLQEKTGDARYVALDTALAADIVSLHVPLTDTGRHATRHLINAARLKRLRPNALLLNTARGDVIDESALLARLDEQPSMQIVIDCWHGEPNINRKLLGRAAIGTAHIAGYSYDGKLRATEMIHAAACRHFGRTAQWQLPADTQTGGYMVDTHIDDEALRRAVLACYDVRADDALLRFALTMGPKHMAPYFDGLRRDYRRRREFGSLLVTSHRRREQLAQRLQALGFSLRLLP